MPDGPFEQMMNALYGGIKVGDGANRTNVGAIVTQGANNTFGQGTADNVINGIPGAFGLGSYNAKGYTVDPNAGRIPGFDFWTQMAQQGAQAAPGRQISPDVRAQQAQLASQLYAQATGAGGPSVAEQQMRAGNEQAMRQALATATATQAGNPGMAARNAAYTQGSLAAQNNADSAMLRAQEQLQARNQLGQLYAGMRGQDLDTQSLNDRASQFWAQFGGGLGESQARNNLGFQQLQGGFDLAAQGLNAQQYADQQRRIQQMWAAVGQGAANVGTMGATGGVGGGFGGLTEATPLTY